MGIEVQVQVSIEFWLHIDLGFFSIDFDFGLSIHLGFTALLEVGILADDFPGARGTATVTIGIMGYDLHFSIHVGLHEEAVEKALALTNPFLQIGLEAGEVEPIPGTSRPRLRHHRPARRGLRHLWVLRLPPRLLRVRDWWPRPVRSRR